MAFLSPITGGNVQKNKHINIMAKTHTPTRFDEGDDNDLIAAAKRGDTELCKRLLENGADVNAADEVGWTPLHSAAANGKTETCKLLLENGADINAEDEGGKTPLHYATVNGNTETCELLKTYGAKE